jgi:hypothetical protein
MVQGERELFFLLFREREERFVLNEENEKKEKKKRKKKSNVEKPDQDVKNKCAILGVNVAFFV